MTRLSSLTLGAGIALASISLAHADPMTGNWKLSLGVNDDPCVVSLAANPGDDTAGTATATGDCNGVNFQDWKTVGNRLQLKESNGTLVAYLQAKDGGFEGKRVSDGKLVALNR